MSCVRTDSEREKMKRINSNRKGKVGERELSAVLRSMGFTEARRGEQYCGANGDADLVGIPGVHIECKRVENLNLNVAMEQAESDSRGDVPAVFHRRDRRPWLVTVRLENMLAFARAILEAPK